MAGSAWAPSPFEIAQVNAAGLMKVQNFTATAGEIAFVLTTYAYAINTGSILVFKNGDILVKTTDYTETDTTTITLTHPAAASDVISIVGMVGISGTTFVDGVLRSDLAASSGTGLLGFIQAGGSMVQQILQMRLRTGEVYLTDGMTSVQQATYLAAVTPDDLTSVYNAAYAACVSEHKQLSIPAGKGRITAGLAWNESVDVIGRSFEFCIVEKDVAGGDFVGITISGAAQQSRFADFRLTTAGTVATSDGILVTASARMRMERVQSDNHGGHGINLHDTGVNGMGVFSRYTDIVTNLNGKDGFHMDYQYASIIIGLNSSQNGGYGFNETQGNSTDAAGIVCENNVLGGSRADTCVGNIYRFYGESNTGADIILTGGSTRNYVITYHADAVTDESDEGTNNVVLDIGLFPMFSCPTISRIPRTTNTQGHDLLIKGGTAGPGATGHKGGKLTLEGGDANGNTISKGNDVQLSGGDGIVGGDGGDTIITGGLPNSTGAYGTILVTNAKEIKVDSGTTTAYTTLNESKGPLRVGGTNASNPNIGFDLQSTTHFMKLNRAVNATIVAFDTTDGQAMFGFNQTAGKLCPVFWDGTAWQKVSFTAM